MVRLAGSSREMLESRSGFAPASHLFKVNVFQRQLFCICFQRRGIYLAFCLSGEGQEEGRGARVKDFGGSFQGVP